MFIFLILSAFVTRGLPCTHIIIKAQSGAIVVGRTMEFGPELQSNLITKPRAHVFSNINLNGKTGKNWKNKYGYLFLNGFGVNHAIDGMNEKGLSFAYLYLPGFTQYQMVPAGHESQSLDYFSLGDWVLGNFSNIDDLKIALKTIYVYARPMNIGPYKNIIFPLHAMITDSSGKSITVEFVKGNMYIYDNSTGILTNSPTYRWQIVNLDNYINLTPYSPHAIRVGSMLHTGTGQGSGAVGLPGDFSPPSRFVKMNFLVTSADPVKNADEALNLAQHIMNNVDVPRGVVRDEKSAHTLSDTTQWILFKDLKNKIIFFKSYKNTTLQAIDLKQLDFSEGARQLSMPVMSRQIIMNVTDSYKK